MSERLTAEFATVEEFLGKLYTFKEATDSQERMKGVDLVYAVIFTILDDLPMKHLDDTMVRLGGPKVLNAEAKNPRFEVIDQILRQASPWEMNDTMSLCLLSITLGCKDKLSEREYYLKRCKRRYLETGNKARAKRLLNGLS
jgi:hypothetical protein